MYRLTYAKFTNVQGFIAGMNRKTVEINLRGYLDKDIMIVLGDNGTGKSTFLSLVHPAVTPVDGRSKFIAPGKEGTVIREYTSEDGTVMLSKCIYRPKKDGSGHTPSCFLEMRRPGEDPIELNPNGNVTSYQMLLYTYFGITKDYLQFASYNAAVSNIVSMTDTERKNSVGAMVPNTKRFEVGYNIINEKYKNLRNMIRNIAQKILSIRDEDSLEADFNRLTKEIKEYTLEREDQIKKMAKIEGRLNELTAGEDVDALITSYDTTVLELGRLDNTISQIMSRLLKLYKKLGIEPSAPNSINFKHIDNVPSYILKYEKKVIASEGNLTQFKSRREELSAELGQVETEIAETEAALYSIQAQDIDELYRLKEEYQKQLEGLRYTKMIDQFEGMSYDELTGFTRVVMTIDQMIQALYDGYGELISEYFNASDWTEYVRHSADDLDQLSVRIQTTSAKRDQVYRQLIEKEQYRNIQAILNQRPTTCTIDTCPFIANALKYRGVANEISALTESYKDLGLTLEGLTSDANDIQRKLTVHTDAQHLVQYLVANEHLIRKYLKVPDLNTLYRAIAHGTWGNYLDIMRLKDMASILSEKDLYLKITMQRLPEIDHGIEMAKIYGTNRDILQRQIEQLRQRKDLLKDGIQELEIHRQVTEVQLERYQTRLAQWKDVSALINQYRECIKDRIVAGDEADKKSQTIGTIRELMTKSKERAHMIEELDDLIRARTPQREQIKLDLDAVRRLKIEKSEVERDFIVADVIRSIVAPGKGVRKELINIYMYDIYTIANQLLLNTFDGQLYLKEFVITDKAFIIPYVYNGTEAPDISVASGAQKTAIISAISLAILSKLVDKYGIYTGDEQDNTLNPKNKSSFIDTLTKQLRYVGITQAFIITQEPSRYESLPDVGFICFPGGEISNKGNDVIYI